MRLFMYGGSYLGRADFRLKFTRVVQWIDGEADIIATKCNAMGWTTLVCGLDGHKIRQSDGEKIRKCL